MKSRRVTAVGTPAYTPRRPAPRPYRPVVTAHRVKRGLKLAVVVIGLWLVYGLFQIDHIDISGHKTMPATEIAEATKQAISRVAVANNLLSLRSNQVERLVSEQKPNIKTVRLQRRWPNRLLVTIVERRPTINWRTGGEEYVLDYDGTVIGGGDGVARPVVVDTANLPVERGKQVAPARFVAFCAQLSQSLPARGLGIVELVVPDTTSEIHVKTDRKYLVKFDTTRGVEEQLKDLQAVLSTLSRDKKVPQEYIDLRIAGKAYWR